MFKGTFSLYTAELLFLLYGICRELVIACRLFAKVDLLKDDRLLQEDIVLGFNLLECWSVDKRNKL